LEEKTKDPKRKLQCRINAVGVRAEAFSHSLHESLGAQLAAGLLKEIPFNLPQIFQFFDLASWACESFRLKSCNESALGLLEFGSIMPFFSVVLSPQK
jgi:hypothetical protein